MKKTALIVIAIALLISACKSKTIDTDDFVVTPISTIQPLSNQPEVTDDLISIIEAEMGWTLDIDPYEEGESETGEKLSVVTIYLVSSGVFDTATLSLEDGGIVQVDIVYAYQFNHAHSVIVIPVAIGMETEDGHYTYFSDGYVLSSAVDLSAPDTGVLTRVSRQKAIQDALLRLGTGTKFRVSVLGFANRTSINWSDCPSEFYIGTPVDVCRAGEQIDRGYSNLVIMKAATSLPNGWMMIGWHFYELPNLGIIDL